MNNSANIFNLSSNLFSDSSVLKSKDDFVREVTPLIEDILKRRFPNIPAKQRIKVYPDRLNFACPVCGDSTTSVYKKRGNIILDGKFAYKYKCHNCGVFMNLTSLLKRFNESMNLNMIDYISANSSHYDNILADSSTNMIFDTEEIDRYAIDKELLKSRCSLLDCTQTHQGSNYLKSRLQYSFEKFLYQPKYNLLFVLNLTKTGKILGMQVRNLNKNYSGPKYKTYNLSNIYKILLKTEINVPDEMNVLSMIFNILLINYSKPVIAVEGPMDSFLLKNCIALCGANKRAPIELDFKYLFDDDDTGRKNAMKQLEEGHDVFLWSKFKKDIGLPQRKKWDINDVYLYCRENNLKIPNIYDYFSSDTFDILEI